MPNNPIDTNSFRHYLNFVSLGFAEPYEITEPVNFDVANFVIAQDDGRFGADIIYGNNHSNETYYNAWGFEKRNVMQTHNPQGETSEYLDMGFAWILETWRRFGAEGQIERILVKDGLTFTIGLFDMANDPNTDGFSYFGCNMIQNNKIANYKKQLTTSIDLLGTKNINNEPITPAPTLKVLRKAVPLIKNSVFSSKNEFSYAQSDAYFAEGVLAVDRFYGNNCNNIIQSGILNTISFTRTTVFLTVLNSDFVFLTATKKLTNVNIILSQINAEYHWNHETSLGLAISGYVRLIARVGSDISTASTIEIWRHNVTDGISESAPLPKNLFLNIPEITVGQKLWIYFTADANLEGYNELATFATYLYITSLVTTITATELALDTVIDMIRYPDVLKQCSKFINDTQIIAPAFEVGGEHYNNAIYNRALLSINANNSIVLIASNNPIGQELGDVVNNTIDNGVMHIGLHFWNGTDWIPLSENITEISLTDNATPSGAEGQLIFNTNTEVVPNGLCFWNNTSWQSLEYSRPVITNFEDAFANSMAIEAFADYEIQEDNISLLEFKYFYENIEIASFLVPPSKEFKEYRNDRFKLNNGKIGYETYDTNRQSENTSEDIHTSYEFNIPNIQSFNKFDKQIKYIRSGQTAQIMVDLETSKPATAYENDEKIFINSIVPMPDGSFGILEQTLFQQYDSVLNQLHILNRQSDGAIDSIVFNWVSLGCNVGDDFIIVSGSNAGTYKVFSVTNSEIILTPVGFIPSFSGDEFIVINNYYGNVFWKTETDERVTIISGLNNIDNYPNLYYSLKRTALKWGSFFRTVSSNYQDKILKKLKFWNNPKLISSYLGVQLTESADINISELDQQIITDMVYDIEIFASFTDVLNLLNTMRTTRGFIRCLHIDGRIIKGYCRKSVDYTWKTGSLKLKIEEKFEPKTIILTYLDGILTVNDAIYDLDGNVNWYKITGEYFICYDAKSQPICNTRHFSEVSLNGVIYSDIETLSYQLSLLTL